MGAVSAADADVEVAPLADDREQVLIDKITVCPINKASNGYVVCYDEINYGVTFNGMNTACDITLTTDWQSYLKRQFEAKGYMQNGWRMKVNYYVDSGSVSSTSVTSEFEGDFSKTDTNVFRGPYVVSNDSIGLYDIPIWSGYTTKSNGVTSAFAAACYVK